MFTHYLITRFNIKVAHYGPERMNSPEMDLEWLSIRLELFLKYCAPSVLEQSNKQFLWLIYLDPETPKTIQEKLDFLKAEMKMEFRYVADYPMMMNDILQMIKSVSTPYVITSRLDNDDIISKYFIQDVQAAFKPQHQLIINFTKGFEYSFLINVLIKWNVRYKNQFISLIEDRNAPDVQSIYGFPHWRPPVKSTIVNITGKPYWIHVKHELNHSGSVISGIPCFLKPAALKVFPETVRKIQVSMIQTFKYSLQWFPQMVKRRLKFKKCRHRRSSV